MVSDIEETKGWAVKRIGHFLEKLEVANDELEILSALYAIKTVAKYAYGQRQTWHVEKTEKVRGSMDRL